MGLGKCNGMVVSAFLFLKSSMAAEPSLSEEFHLSSSSSDTPKAATCFDLYDVSAHSQTMQKRNFVKMRLGFKSRVWSELKTQFRELFSAENRLPVTKCHKNLKRDLHPFIVAIETVSRLYCILPLPHFSSLE